MADFGFSRVLPMGDIRTKTHGAISHTAPELLLDGLLSKAADVRGWGREGFVWGVGDGAAATAAAWWTAFQGSMGVRVWAEGRVHLHSKKRVSTC